MKQSTLKKYLNILKAVKESNKTLKDYCKDADISYNQIVKTISKIRELRDFETELVDQILCLYGEITTRSIESSENLTSCKVDTDDKSKISYERDENGKIKYYNIRLSNNKNVSSGYFGFPSGELPDWAPKIALDIQWEKTIVDPINRFLEVMDLPLVNSAGVMQLSLFGYDE